MISKNKMAAPRGAASTKGGVAAATAQKTIPPVPPVPLQIIHHQAPPQSSSKKYCKGTNQRREKFHTEHIVAKESDDHGDPGSDGWGLHIPQAG